MSGLAASLGPSAYWYVTRATGAVALLLMTVVVVLGVMGSMRFSAAPRWPRFAVDALHRDISLLVIALVVVHVITTVLDGFAPITLLDGLIPFRSPYRPVWLGLGAVAFDLLIALAITSLVRRRLGYRSWRAIHWLAYASWPIAVLHGLGTGSDVKSAWLMALTVACVAAVVGAVLLRISRSETTAPGLRSGTTLLAVATPIGLAAFAAVGPLAKGWAHRAGTPKPHTVRATPVARHAPPNPLAKRFSASLNGTISQTNAPGGEIVELTLGLSGGVNGQMRIRLGGAPLSSGGLSLAGSQVDLTAPGLPSAYGGKVDSLNGGSIAARVSDVAGAKLALQINLSIDQNTGAVTGTITGTPI